jgi:hypothetical protein
MNKFDSCIELIKKLIIFENKLNESITKYENGFSELIGEINKIKTTIKEEINNDVEINKNDWEQNDTFGINNHQALNDIQNNDNNQCNFSFKQQTFNEINYDTTNNNNIDLKHNNSKIIEEEGEIQESQSSIEIISERGSKIDSNSIFEEGQLPFGKQNEISLPVNNYPTYRGNFLEFTSSTGLYSLSKAELISLIHKILSGKFSNPTNYYSYYSKNIQKALDLGSIMKDVKEMLPKKQINKGKKPSPSVDVSKTGSTKVNTNSIKSEHCATFKKNSNVEGTLTRELNKYKAKNSIYPSFD